jgi:Uma2 family endonuclease
VHEKALYWITCGTRLVWVIEPVAQMVTVYRPDGSQRVLRTDDVLPGFSVRVRELFPDG